MSMVIRESDCGRTESQCEALVSAAEQRVVTTRWYPESTEHDHPAPLWTERDGRDEPHLLTASDRRGASDRACFGYDRDGSLLLATRRDTEGNLRTATVWVSLDGHPRIQLWFHRVMGALRLGRAAAPELDEHGRLVRLRVQYDPRERLGELEERYDYDDRHLLRRIRSIGRRPGEPDQVDEYVVDYDESGALLVIRMIEASGSHVVYRRRASNEVAKARRLFEAQVVEMVPQWVARTYLRGAPAPYCLALVYSHEAPPVPPALALRVEEPGPPMSYARFAPLEFPLFDPEPIEYDSPDFQAACQLLNQEWRSTESPTEPRATLVKIAKRLADRDWSSVLPTRRLIIYAVDDELGDLERNLRAAGVSIK